MTLVLYTIGVFAMQHAFAALCVPQHRDLAATTVHDHTKDIAASPWEEVFDVSSGELFV
jgi:hypothetical protein